MNPKDINFDPLPKLIKGVNTISDAVKSTLGPKGRNVLIQTLYGTPHITKDGVTVANSITLKDPVENIAAQVVKQAAAKTVSQAGDGTTTAMVLAQALVNNAYKYIQAGASPNLLKKGIEQALSQVVSQLKGQSESIKGNWDKLEQVARISANNDDEIGSIIRQALQTAGEYGVVAVQESKSTDTFVDHVQGYQFDRGYVSPYFINNSSKLTCELEKPLILITDRKLRYTNDLVPALEIAAQAGRPLLVIGDEIEAQGLGILVVNKMKAGLQLCAVKAPAFADRRKAMLEDLAILTGGTVVSESSLLKLAEVKPQHLGSAEKVIITKNDTTIINGSGDDTKISDRVEELKAELAQSESKWDKEKASERLGKLIGGVAMIYVGAATEVELKEKKDRIDDALQASKAAIEEGILPGGGISLLSCEIKVDEDLNEDVKLGYKILKQALSAPLNTIAINCGKQAGEILSDLYYQWMESGNKSTGYNAADDTFENLKEAGIIDPTKVVRCALENAASVASMLITSNTTITNLPSNEPSFDDGDIDVQPPF